jgi:hypothetical protein
MADQYRSLHTISLLAITAIAIVALFDVASVIAGIGQIVMPEARIGMESTWLFVQGLIALANFLFFILAAVFFLIWLNRAYKNLEALRAEYLEFSSGWAVGWWFVPFANLIKPFQVVREVWSESDPEATEEYSFLSTSLHKAPTYMVIWWIAWIVMNALANVSGRLATYESRESIVLSGYLEIVAGTVAVAAGILARMVVRDITKRQKGRSTRVGVLPPAAPPPPPVFGN